MCLLTKSLNNALTNTFKEEEYYLSLKIYALKEACILKRASYVFVYEQKKNARKILFFVVNYLFLFEMQQPAVMYSHLI